MSIRQVQLDDPGRRVLLMGNEAIARGAIEAGLAFCSTYPGSPTVEIPATLFELGSEFGIYGEWSVNEKVALEAAAAASFAGLRSMCVVKHNGLHVAADFLLTLNLSGNKGGLLLVVGDDPSAHSSLNETDSRHMAAHAEIPLLEPSTPREAKEMTAWALELSEQLRLVVMMRVTTRICHARGNVELGEISHREEKPDFGIYDRFLGSALLHGMQHMKLQNARWAFETSPFNHYEGPADAATIVVACGPAVTYAREAIRRLGLTERVGLLKLGTTWPLPEDFVVGNLKSAHDVIFMEEIDPVLETRVKALLADKGLAGITFHGQASAEVGGSRGPGLGELNPDIATAALARITGAQLVTRRPADRPPAMGTVMDREMTFCAGCPHRASFWAIKSALEMDGRGGFALGDIGCYSLGALKTGYNALRTLHSMGSGLGLANGFGQLSRFGFDQPVMAVIGDSTFFHAGVPALINARYNEAKFTAVVLDNSATAMTGFQPHPGTGTRAGGAPAPTLTVEQVCAGLGIPVTVADPYDVEATVEAILDSIEQPGVNVLILRRACATMTGKQTTEKRRFYVDQEKCRGDACGCARFCARVFACPGNIWDAAAGKAKIDDVVCVGCGVCATLCPQGAIKEDKGVA